MPSANYLPTEAGIGRVGHYSRGQLFELLGVRMDTKHPGFFHVAQMEACDGAASECEPNGGRPVRADFVREWFKYMMRRPENFDQIEWRDHPLDRWPFSEPPPRWPSKELWKKADDAEVQQ